MSEEKFDTVIFKKKTFGNLLEEIHSSSKNTDKIIFEVIQDMKELIGGLGDAIRLAPIIATYIKMSIDNNEHIIKIAAIVQKSLEKAKAAGADTGDSMFTEEDKLELIQAMEEWEKSKGQLPDSTGSKVISSVKTSKKLPAIAG